MSFLRIHYTVRRYYKNVGKRYHATKKSVEQNLFFRCINADEFSLSFNPITALCYTKNLFFPFFRIYNFLSPWWDTTRNYAFTLVWMSNWFNSASFDIEKLSFCCHHSHDSVVVCYKSIWCQNKSVQQTRSF